MMWPRICPVCRQELPESGNRRVYVPWKRGFRLVHAGDCFERVDAQLVLEPAPVMQKPAPLLRVRIRRLAQLLGGEQERRQLTDEDRESVRRISRLLAREEHVDVAGDPDERLQHRLLNHSQVLHLMRQLAHQGEVSGPSRTEAIFS